MTAAALNKGTEDRLLDALANVPGTDSRDGRTALLQGIPHNVKAALNRSDNQWVDLTNIIDQLERLGRLENGERPIVIVTHNGWRMSSGTELGQLLAKLEREIETSYGGDVPLAELPATPEVVISGGTGEWVTAAFIEQARLAGCRVARLRVPRYLKGSLVRPVGGVGTGWLIAPGLLLTNHHVIQARELNEPQASDTDFKRQGEKTVLWFDYHREGQDESQALTAASVAEVVTSSRELDYALLRLLGDASLTVRTQAEVAREILELPRGARLNIVQCPGGGPLRYAIRNNFFVGFGEHPYQMRYLTDTMNGSSGAPVFDDNWQVVAMHHGYKKVDPALYEKGAESSTIKYHNEGIIIRSIFDDMPSIIQQEISAAQGWA